MSEPISREEFHQGIDSLRSEFSAGLTTAGVQIGAVEKTLLAKIGNVKAWGIACLLGGQVTAGVVAAIVGPKATAEQIRSALSIVGLG